MEGGSIGGFWLGLTTQGQSQSVYKFRSASFFWGVKRVNEKGDQPRPLCSYLGRSAEPSA